MQQPDWSYLLSCLKWWEGGWPASAFASGSLQGSRNTACGDERGKHTLWPRHPNWSLKDQEKHRVRKREKKKTYQSVWLTEQTSVISVYSDVEAGLTSATQLHHKEHLNWCQLNKYMISTAWTTDWLFYRSVVYEAQCTLVYIKHYINFQP